MYKVTTHITYKTSKSLIKEFATTHGCVLSKYKPLENNGEQQCEFASHNIHFIMELCDQLQIPHSEINYQRIL